MLAWRALGTYELVLNWTDLGVLTRFAHSHPPSRFNFGNSVLHDPDQYAAWLLVCAKYLLTGALELVLPCSVHKLRHLGPSWYQSGILPKASLGLVSTSVSSGSLQLAGVLPVGCLPAKKIAYRPCKHGALFVLARNAVTSASFLAEISVSSPRKIIMFII